MPTVRLAFSSVPQYVRTARLVGVAMARRAGVPDDLLDEVRLAVGEACGRAVARHRQHRITDLVRVEMSDDGPYVVRVIDACGAGRAEVAGPDQLDEDEDADRMHETLLAATVHDLQVHRNGSGTEVRMAWPVHRRLAAAGRG